MPSKSRRAQSKSATAEGRQVNSRNHNVATGQTGIDLFATKNSGHGVEVLLLNKCHLAFASPATIETIALDAIFAREPNGIARLQRRAFRWPHPDPTNLAGLWHRLE